MKYILLSILLFLTATGYGQVSNENSNEEWYPNQNNDKEPIYQVMPALEIPLAVGLSALSGYGFKQLYRKNGSTEEEILALDYTRDVAAINRWTPEPRYSTAAAKRSDFIFYGSFALGLIPAFDKNINKDYMRIFLMYFEAIAITGSIYSMTAGHVDKYRPLAYSDDAPMDVRREDGSKNSFPGGHPSLTATATFFVAKVFSDYYPNRKGLKITLFSSAAALTLANAYFRWDAGKHFPTDLAVGMAQKTWPPTVFPSVSGRDEADVFH